MPGVPQSNEVKEFAMQLVDSGALSVKDLVAYGPFSASTVSRLRQQWVENGRSLGVKEDGRPVGRPRLISYEAQKFLQRTLKRKGDRPLDDLQIELAGAGYGDFTRSTIWETLNRMRWTHKKMDKVAVEQNPEERARFRTRIGQYDPQQLVFVDESSFDWRTTHRPYGRAPANERVRYAYPYTRGPRYSVLPALSLEKGVFAIQIIEKSFGGEAMFAYLEEVLLPQCEAFPGNNSVIVMDNNSAHHIPEIRELVEFYGCKLEYLPAYSPDYNPIEKVFGKMKSIMKKGGAGGDIRWRIERALSEITKEDIEGYYRYSSYLGDDREV